HRVHDHERRSDRRHVDDDVADLRRRVPIVHDLVRRGLLLAAAHSRPARREHPAPAHVGQEMRGSPMSTIAPARRSRNGLTAVRATIAGVFTLLFIGPILWMITTAFKTGNQAFSSEIQWFFTPTLS